MKKLRTERHERGSYRERIEYFVLRWSCPVDVEEFPRPELGEEVLVEDRHLAGELLGRNVEEAAVSEETGGDTTGYQKIKTKNKQKY